MFPKKGKIEKFYVLCTLLLLGSKLEYPLYRLKKTNGIRCMAAFDKKILRHKFKNLGLDSDPDSATTSTESGFINMHGSGSETLIFVPT